MFRERLEVRKLYVVGGAFLLFLASVVLVTAAFQTGKTSAEHTSFNALWFIGLLVVFMGALAVTAAIFNGLHLSNALEAFGLPTGSVRALLAIGIMLVFVVFGLNFFNSASQSNVDRLTEKPIQVAVPFEERASEVARYTRLGFVVVVTAYGAAASAPATAASAARLDLHRLDKSLPASAIDVEKQIITAIVTLLTTVIGFYFGSRSSAEGYRKRGAANPGGATTLSELAAAKGEAAKGFEILEKPLLEREQVLRDNASAPPKEPSQIEALQFAREQANATADSIEKTRKEGQRAVAALEKAIKDLGVATVVDMQKVHEGTARDALAALKTATESLRTTGPKFVAQVKVVLDLI
jgi:hypothetical protein